MSTAQRLLSVAVLLVLLAAVTASVPAKDNASQGRDSKVKVKKAFKEAALLLQVVKNLGQLATLLVGPLLQLKLVSISAFTSLVTFFWFAYELLKAKQPTAIKLVLPPGKSPLESSTSHPQPTVAILPVVTSHDHPSAVVHTYDYEDYGDVYNYRQHLGKRHNYHGHGR